MDVVCSALAGILARLISHPLDTVKSVTFTGFAGDNLGLAAKGASSAAPAAPCGSFSQSARSIWVREGVAGFYRGVGVAVVGSAPGVALYLTTYNWCSETWKELGDQPSNAEKTTERDGNCEALGLRGTVLGPVQCVAAATPSSVRFFVSGLIAEAVSCLVWVPIDVAKERLQCQPPSLAGRYVSSLDALKRILANEGVRGLYKGYASTIASFGPFSAVYFVCYEYFTTILAKLNAAASPLPTKEVQRSGNHIHFFPSNFFVALGAGAAGNVMASLLTNPLELVKTRMQVQRAVLHRERVGTSTPTLFTYHYRSLREGLVTVAKEEGVGALWRGAGSRIAYAAPNAALTMGFFELLKAQLK